MAYSSTDTVISDAVPGRLKENFCQPCSRKSAINVADVYCEDCTEYQCKECVKVHDIYSVMSKHTWINANEASCILPKYDMKGLDQCQEHNRILEFYCEDDNKLCCSTCAIINHRKCHTVIEITNEASKSVNKLTKLKQNFLQIDLEADSTLKQMVKIKDRIESSKITERIKDMQDNVTNIFENLKITVAKDIATCQQQISSDFVKAKDLRTSLTGEVKLALANIENVSQHGTPSQQFIMANHLTNQATKLEEETTRVRECLHDVVISFDFDGSMKLPPDQNIVPGKLTINYIELIDADNSVDYSRAKANDCREESSYDIRPKDNFTGDTINVNSSTREKRDYRTQYQHPCKAMDESSSTNEKKYEKSSNENHSCYVKDGSSSINKNSYRACSSFTYPYNANDDLTPTKEKSFDESAHVQITYPFNMNEYFSSTKERNSDKSHLGTHPCYEIDELESKEGKSNDRSLGEKCVTYYEEDKAAISSTSRDNYNLRMKKDSSYETDDLSLTKNNTIDKIPNTENLGYKKKKKRKGGLSRRQKRNKLRNEMK